MMRKFTCHCGNALYFENTACLRCSRTLGFAHDSLVLTAIEPAGEGLWRALAPETGGRVFRLCSNYSQEDVCNWLVPSGEGNRLCFSCGLNNIIPNLAKPDNRRLWFKVEQAKRRLLYTLLTLGLPVVGREADPEAGLVFNFMEDDEAVSSSGRVLTGHYRGSITINIREADESTSEKIKKRMNEKYRTVLGHFRHEIGHYYWDRLICGTKWIDGFRETFGDERADYRQALDRYYSGGRAPAWEKDFISAYATSHPWEDWCETFSHYLHMMDTLETAYDYGFAIHGETLTHPSEVLKDRTLTSDSGRPSFDKILENMVSLSLVMNALNRSMGVADPYPFSLTGAVANKLRFVHYVISEAANPGN